MKHLAILPIFVVIALSLTSFMLPAPSLIGKWKGNDGGEVGIISFDKEGYVTFEVNGQEVGGKDYESEGMIFDMFYETDETVVPHKIDFIIKMNDDQSEIARMLGIYTFTDDNTLIINMKFDGSPRPTTLDETSPDQITLIKQDEKKSKKKKKK